MKKHRFQFLEQQNSNQLDVDTILSVKAAGWVTATVAAAIVFLSRQPFTFTHSYNLVLAALMLFGFVFLLLLGIGYGRYRSVRTFWEYLRSLKPIPPSHHPTPIVLNLADSTTVAVRCQQLFLIGVRRCSWRTPKSKVPILLFQQAPLLLAP